MGGNDEEEPELSNKNKGKETAQDNSQENDNVSNEGTRLHDNQQTTILKETTRIEKGEKDKKDRNAAIVEKTQDHEHGHSFGAVTKKIRSRRITFPLMRIITLYHV